MQKIINCPGGYIVRGESDDHVAAKAHDDARPVYQMELSGEQALAMANPA